jgi:hypothetical protein
LREDLARVEDTKAVGLSRGQSGNEERVEPLRQRLAKMREARVVESGGGGVERRRCWWWWW